MLTESDLAEIRGVGVANAGELLDKAAEILERVSLRFDSDVVDNRGEILGVSLLGAVSLAMGKAIEHGAIHRSSSQPQRLRSRGFNNPTMSKERLTGKRLIIYTDAMRLLCEVAGYGDLLGWSEARERTHEEALDVLYQAAALAHQREL